MTREITLTYQVSNLAFAKLATAVSTLEMIKLVELQEFDAGTYYFCMDYLHGLIKDTMNDAVPLDTVLRQNETANADVTLEEMSVEERRLVLFFRNISQQKREELVAELFFDGKGNTKNNNDQTRG